MGNDITLVDQALRAMAVREGKYLTFSLDAEEYGIEILKVKEIVGMMNITRIPQAPAYIKGVVNLRGKVIPVVDLRLKFGLDAMDYTERTCIIVVEILAGDKNMAVGVIVDSVSEVINIRGNDIQETPAFGGHVNTDYILGMAKTNGGVKILLDIDRILSSAEITVLEQII
ncbi:MAG: purine-binding chemotaxis protein CheW [Deltaproteobacteria bacterium]|nr:purine-binding chemotaxis protein CheW [Deltaproteobacteria bacterium]